MKISQSQLYKVRLWFLLILLVIFVDQLTKYVMSHHFHVESSLRLSPFFNLILSYNQGAAFSFLKEAGGWQVAFFSIISVIVIVVLLIWLLRLSYPNAWTACALSFLIGGAAGNLIDRMRIAFVIDFIDFHIKDWHFATFNVADSAIVTGVLMLLLKTFFKKKELF